MAIHTLDCLLKVVDDPIVDRIESKRPINMVKPKRLSKCWLLIDRANRRDRLNIRLRHDVRLRWHGNLRKTMAEPKLPGMIYLICCISNFIPSKYCFSYTVEYQELGSSFWEKVSDSIGGATAYTVRGLEHGKQYVFRIRAENMVGVGEALLGTPVTAKDPFSMLLLLG